MGGQQEKQLLSRTRSFGIYGAGQWDLWGRTAGSHSSCGLSALKQDEFLWVLPSVVTGGGFSVQLIAPEERVNILCAPLLLTSSSLGCQCLGWRRSLAQERVFAQTLHSNRVGSAVTLTHRLKTPPSAAGPLLCCVGLRALVAKHPRVLPTSALWGASFDFWPRFGIPVGNCGVEAVL